jgi:hypothetical protein
MSVRERRRLIGAILWSITETPHRVAVGELGLAHRTADPRAPQPYPSKAGGLTTIVGVFEKLMDDLADGRAWARAVAFAVLLAGVLLVVWIVFGVVWIDPFGAFD